MMMMMTTTTSSVIYETVFSLLSFGVSLRCNGESKEVKMPKKPKKHGDPHFRQMSLRLFNESLPSLDETIKEEIIFALATLLLEVADSDDITQGVMKDEC